MTLRGIDISEFQTVYDYSLLANEIDFAIIRGGFGYSTIDKQFDRNVEGCIKNKIPYGVYWFSYALNENDAKEEAEFLIAMLAKYSTKPQYPIFFDWEYDSDRYAKQHGVNMTKAKLSACARAFCKKIEEAGYIAGVYTNLDYINRMYEATLFSEYVLWLAQWADKQSYEAPIWQYSEKGELRGIYGQVDLDLSHADYTKITSTKPTPTQDISKCIDIITQQYNTVCHEVMSGKWGAGDERKKSLIKAGYNYDIVQSIITYAYKMAGEL